MINVFAVYATDGSLEDHLTELDNWVGEGKSPTLSKSKDSDCESDILRAILELLHHRARKGFPTFFIKIREGEAPRARA